ncbi:hypothetical protein POM88_031017 [Heracleum sosnowskyi]|uniref:Uncharacterized protein n=1 Tax=Heracleum sosnowskyi TaxID=360622 RepID=A0AAD8MJC2_9APIA|nr:hypothetical protein POM88_031017 [Heracleum sosnowskyi]
MAPKRQTRSTDTSDQEGQQNTPLTGRMDPMVIQLLNTLTQQTAALAQQQRAFQQQLLEQQQQHQHHQHQQHQQHHQQAAPAVMFKSFQAAKPPEFKGSTDPVEAKAWLKEMEKAFALIEVAEDKKTEYASYFLKNEPSIFRII